jgi:hypothetical protein
MFNLQSFPLEFTKFAKLIIDHTNVIILKVEGDRIEKSTRGSHFVILSLDPNLDRDPD